MSDASDVRRLAGAREVAVWTLAIPHPYENGMAEQWIESQRKAMEDGKLVNFAITLAADEVLIGSIGMEIQDEHEHARLGYWLGVPYWNRGYGTEAVKAVLAYGFDTLHLHRIYAPHFSGNLASGRVLQKVGMRHEGRLREHYVRFGRRVDLELYGMLESDFREQPWSHASGESAAFFSASN
jgi:RimJ/RimL family protein N-acetyltransferase